MNVELQQYLGALAFGEAQTSDNITIPPIVSGLNHSPNYLTLGEAAVVDPDYASRVHPHARLARAGAIHRGNRAATSLASSLD